MTPYRVKLVADGNGRAVAVARGVVHRGVVVRGSWRSRRPLALTAFCSAAASAAVLTPALHEPVYGTAGRTTGIGVDRNLQRQRQGEGQADLRGDDGTSVTRRRLVGVAVAKLTAVVDALTVLVTVTVLVCTSDRQLCGATLQGFGRSGRSRTRQTQRTRAEHAGQGRSCYILANRHSLFLSVEPGTVPGWWTVRDCPGPRSWGRLIAAGQSLSVQSAWGTRWLAGSSRSGTAIRPTVRNRATSPVK